jgi:hypothetical protein
MSNHSSDVRPEGSKHSKLSKASRDYQKKHQARRLRGRLHQRLEAPSPGAAVACWSHEEWSADRPAGTSADRTGRLVVVGQIDGHAVNQSAGRAKEAIADRTAEEATADLAVEEMRADDLRAEPATERTSEKAAVVEGNPADERERANEEERREKSILLLKPRGPAQGFFNRDKLEQFSFFAK